MLEKYLSEKNISIEEIKKLFPDLAELIQSYQDIYGAEGFQSEVDKIGREIISLLKDRESQIDDFVKSRKSLPVTETSEESETESEDDFLLGDDIVIDLGDEAKAEPEVEIKIDDGIPHELEVIGNKFEGVEFKQDMFLKILSAVGMEFNPKVKPGTSYYFWMKDDNNYFITDGMPFDAKVDVWAIGDEKLSNIIQSKANYVSKEDVNSPPVETGGITEDAVTAEDKEPITGMTFRQVDEAVGDLFNIQNMSQLVTLLDLSRKYGCGCGSI